MKQLNSSIDSVIEHGNYKVIFISTVKNPEVNEKLIYTSVAKRSRFICISMLDWWVRNINKKCTENN